MNNFLLMLLLMMIYANSSLAMQDFTCGEYVVHGYFQLDDQKRPFILLNEKSFSEVSIFLNVKDEDRRILGVESFKGYFTIDIKAKGTLLENVDLKSFQLDPSPHLRGQKGDVVLIKSKPCTKVYTPPPAEHATYNTR